MTKLGTQVRLPDGSEVTVLFNGLSWVGIKWGLHDPDPADFDGTFGGVLNPSRDDMDERPLDIVANVEPPRQSLERWSDILRFTRAGSRLAYCRGGRLTCEHCVGSCGVEEFEERTGRGCPTEEPRTSRFQRLRWAASDCMDRAYARAPWTQASDWKGRDD